MPAGRTALSSSSFSSTTAASSVASTSGRTGERRNGRRKKTKTTATPDRHPDDFEAAVASQSSLSFVLTTASPFPPVLQLSTATTLTYRLVTKLARFSPRAALSSVQQRAFCFWFSRSSFLFCRHAKLLFPLSSPLFSLAPCCAVPLVS